MFLHHHLMSAEHVLAMKMKQMYEHYTVRTQQRVVHQLSEKVCSHFSSSPSVDLPQFL